jgi:hypothetical protein
MRSNISMDEVNSWKDMECLLISIKLLKPMWRIEKLFLGSSCIYSACHSIRHNTLFIKRIVSNTMTCRVYAVLKRHTYIVV